MYFKYKKQQLISKSEKKITFTKTKITPKAFYRLPYMIIYMNVNSIHLKIF